MGEYYTASSVEDAYTRLRQSDGHSEVIAGGQTQMLHLRQGLKDPDLLVDISEIDELCGIDDEGDVVTIGSGVTYSELADSRVIRSEFPYFADAVSRISGPQVRNQGTLGGGLCYADPALDSPPVLLTLDAEIEARGPDKKRTLPLTEFYTGYYATDLDPHEILTRVVVPKFPERSGGRYRTMTPRQGDYAIAGVAVRLTIDKTGTCETVRIALTNGGDIPKRATMMEDTLEGTTATRESVDEAVASLDQDLDLLEDEQTPRSYKETVFKRLARKTVVDVHDSLTEETND